MITEDNLHQSLLVSSMLESPINTLYQAVKQVFAPVLLKVSLSLCIKEVKGMIKDKQNIVNYHRIIVILHILDISGVPNA